MDLQIGIQLFSVVDYMMKDPIDAVKQVVQSGYKNLEVANHNAQKDPGVGFGVPAGEMKQLLNELGAQVVGAHIAPMVPETIDEIIRYHSAIGNKYLINAMSFFPDEDSVTKLAADFREIGKRCRDNGMMYLYHNHFHEFQEFGGKPILYALADLVPEDEMGFEIDTFWCMRAGYDPVEVLKTLGTRVKLVHQKDFSKTTKAPKNLFDVIDPKAPITMETFMQNADRDAFTEIGEGIMDIQAIIDCARDLGSISHLILEQDASQHDTMESIRISRKNLGKYTGLVQD